MSATKFYQREQERHELVYSLPCPLQAALHIVNYGARAFEINEPAIVVSLKTQHPYAVLTIMDERALLVMREGFTFGELMHEMTHAVLFKRAGINHRHDGAFEALMDELCRWLGDGPWLDEAVDAIPMPT